MAGETVTGSDALAIVVSEFCDISGLVKWCADDNSLTLLLQIYGAAEQSMLNKMIQCAQDGDIEAVIVYGNRIKDIQAIHDHLQETF